MLRAAELHRVHTAAGPGVHASLQELDPPRGGQTLRRVLLGSRVQLRTCRSGLQHIGAPTVAALILAHSSTERRQPATSNCWLALHRLERGGAARASQGSKTSSGDGRSVSTRHSRGASDAEAEATDSDPEVHVTEPLAEDPSSDGEDTPTGVEESAAPAVTAAPHESV